MSTPSERTAAWEWTGIVAALLVVLALPAWWFAAERHRTAKEPSVETATFVGSESCRDCHNAEYDTWLGSHHDLAMAEATDETVLGDFNDAEVTLYGITSRFYRRDGRFYTWTNGPGGEMGEFEITHTFGWFPLQQYLVPFPGGRLQALHIAWDSRDNRWFLVAPGGPVEPDDWLYWTNAAQNWNGMCAQCHSTNLQKNYDPQTDSYDTTWSDIDVGCEACHGPGSRHLAWAQMPDMARPEAPNYELARQTSGLSAHQLVEQCAACHARRAALGDIDHTETDLLDEFLPSLLTEDLYFADGQILEEVYVYGSFIQSKMYRHDVRCSDCHDVHSIKLVKEGNALCTQCHRAAQYDTYEHHFHQAEGAEAEPIRDADGDVLFEVGSGAQCMQCHMPGRYYMVVDYRPDHGFRIPDPVLSAEIGAPDACLRCHVDRDSAWSQETVEKWYGPGRRAHYGRLLARGRAGDATVLPELAALAADGLYPVNVRATALQQLAGWPGPQTTQAMEIGLLDEEALLRRTAVANLTVADEAALVRLLTPLLYDPVKTVRIEAARRLAGPPARRLAADQHEVYERVLAEYEASQWYSADFPHSRHNLANLFVALDRPDDAMRQYREAIRIDGQFFPAKVNLAMLYNQRGQNDEAERLLREVLSQQPELYDVAYSLGLLLVEMQQPEQAVEYLAQAAAGLPDNPRIHYNLGLLYQQLRQFGPAEEQLGTALTLQPDNPDFQYALASFLMNLGRFDDARPLVEHLIVTHPDAPVLRQMLNAIEANSEGD